jgi:hypothetical protein
MAGGASVPNPPAARRSLTTIVPAAKSPRRWLLLVTRMDTIPATIAVPHTSTMRMMFRTALGPKVIGCPLSITTRSPFHRLPGVRPAAHTSNAMSYANRARNAPTITTMIRAVPPTPSAAISPMSAPSTTTRSSASTSAAR